MYRERFPLAQRIVTAQCDNDFTNAWKIAAEILIFIARISAQTFLVFVGARSFGENRLHQHCPEMFTWVHIELQRLFCFYYGEVHSIQRPVATRVSEIQNKSPALNTSPIF